MTAAGDDHVGRPQAVLPALAAPVDQLWHVLLGLAQGLPSDPDGRALWTLVGGQMVLLHAVEHNQLPPQVSQDGDVVADVRAERDAIGRVVHALESAAFSVDGMTPDLIAHRFVRPASPRPVTIDVLAPEGLGPRPLFYAASGADRPDARRYPGARTKRPR